MKLVYENKMEKDIKNREEREKKTFSSLFNNHERSEVDYKKINVTNNNTSRKREYFGKDIKYGMIRCRNRE